MKKEMKLVVLIYLGVAILTYALTLRVEHLESQEDYQNQKEEIVYRTR